MNNFSETMVKNTSFNIDNIDKLLIKSCKYLLPCGKCDKTDELCTQFKIIKLIDKEIQNE